MKTSALISKKELRSYFDSPAAYIVLIGFLLIIGWFFSNTLFIMNQATLMNLFKVAPIVFLFVIPASTMGLIAKEKSSGTIELLTTLPINTEDVILGKFKAALVLISIGLLLTLVHVITIALIGYNLDYGVILCGYIGLFLVIAVYCSIGVFASAITDNQIVAFIISFVICFFFFIIEHILIFIPGFAVEFFQFLSIGYHFANISRGVIDTRDILYFVSIVIIFLRLAFVAMETRKWR